MYNQGLNTIYQPYGQYLPQISVESDPRSTELEMQNLDGRDSYDSFASDAEWQEYLHRTYGNSSDEPKQGSSSETMAGSLETAPASPVAIIGPVKDERPLQRQVSEESFRNRGNWRSFINRAFNTYDDSSLITTSDETDKPETGKGNIRNRTNWKSFINKAFKSIGEKPIGTIEESEEQDSTGHKLAKHRIAGASADQLHSTDTVSEEERGIDVVDAEPNISQGSRTENSSWVSVHLQDDQSPSSNDNDEEQPESGDQQHMRGRLNNFYEREKKVLQFYFLVLAFILYNVYLGFAINFNWDKCIDWCSGSKLLLILTIIVYIWIFYYCLIKPYMSRPTRTYIFMPLDERTRRFRENRHLPLFLYIIIFIILLAFVIYDSSHQPERLISYTGLWVLLLLGYLFSKDRHKVNFRPVAWGICLQFLFGLLILRWGVGQSIFECLGNRISLFLSFTDAGSTFVFNYLASGILQGGSVTIHNATINSTNVGTITGELDLPKQFGVFAFKILPVIFFFSLCVSILYYWGVLQLIVLKIGWFLQVTLGTTAPESLNASANIFLGQSEAPLLIKPYLPLMTKSELHAVMTGGFATIAGTVFAAYTSFGISPSHLLSASVMSAPAALAYSKLFYPETEAFRGSNVNLRVQGIKVTEHNVLEAAANGVVNAITLVVRIIGNLVAFLAFIYFLDQMVIFFGSLVGWKLSMTFLLSKLCMPLAFMMGIPWKDCDEVGELIGIKTILNEFVAYSRLSEMKGTISPRSEAIATYALCGFSNFGSIGIQLGCLGGMAPTRIRDLAEISFRAMIAGSAACFMTACIAGALMPIPSS